MSPSMAHGPNSKPHQSPNFGGLGGCWSLASGLPKQDQASIIQGGHGLLGAFRFRFLARLDGLGG